MHATSDGQERAVLLHVRPFGESGHIFEWLGEQHGRFATLAKGKKWRQNCQPCLLYAIAWRGMGELPRLVRADLEGPMITLVGEQLYCALYMNELLLKLTERWTCLDDMLFNYLSTLEHIRHGALALGLRQFEWKLLESLGYGLDQVDSRGVKLKPDNYYVWLPEKGLTPTQDDKQGVPGNAIVSLLAERWDDAVALAARRLNFARIQYLLKGRSLHSREMLRKYWLEKKQGERGDDR